MARDYQKRPFKRLIREKLGGVSEPLPLRRSWWMTPVGPGSQVTRLELFYDLIFVFAFLNVTDLVSQKLTLRSALSAVVVLALLWFCWTVFASLSNLVRADHGVFPFLGFAVMAAVFVLAVTMPQAFVDRPGDLPGPAVFAVCYLTVRALMVTAFLCVLRTAGRSREQLILLTIPPMLAAVLIGLATVAHRWAPPGTGSEVRIALWLAALIVEYSVGLVLPYARWSVASAGHWAERHGLIVLIALGEAVISLGTGPGRFERLQLTAPVIIASVLGIALIAALWWLHFDTLTPSVEQALHGTRDQFRIPLARDAFTYLHLLIIISVVATALGLKLVIGAVAGPGRDPLPMSTVVPLYGGVTLYLLADLLIVARTFRRLRFSNLVTCALLALLIVPAGRVAPLSALGVLVAISVALALLQRFTGASARKRVRRSLRQEEEAVEQALTEWRGRHL